MANLSKIMARFLPLMDLSTLLLGLFIVILSVAKFEEAAISKTNAENEVYAGDFIKAAVKNQFFVVPLFASCDNENGREYGKCYGMDERYNISDKEIRTDTNEDIIKEIEKYKKNPDDNRKPLVLLFSEKGAWDSDWSVEVLKSLETKWKEHYPNIQVGYQRGLEIQPKETTENGSSEEKNSEKEEKQ